MRDTAWATLVVRANWRKTMVTVTLFLEGGAPLAQQKANVAIAENAETLRKSLHLFFKRLLSRDDISIVLQLKSNCRSAAMSFAAATDCVYLYIDSDCFPDSVDDWIDRYNENGDELQLSEEQKKRIFFMVQEMEAWFLKQPECLERWAHDENYIRLHTEQSIAEHSLLKNKNIENIRKPSNVTSTLVKHFYKKPNGNKVKYGKMKSAPGILNHIDVGNLLPIDAELQRFVSSVDTLCN